MTEIEAAMMTPRRSTLPSELVRDPPKEWDVLSFVHEILPRYQLMLLKFRFANTNEDVLFLPSRIVQQLHEDLEIASPNKYLSSEPVGLTRPVILPGDRDRSPGGINRVARSLIVHCDASQILLAALLDPTRSIYRCLRLVPSIGLSLRAAADEAIKSKQLSQDVRAGNAG